VYAAGTAQNYFGGAVTVMSTVSLPGGGLLLGTETPAYGSRAEIRYTASIAALVFHPNTDAWPYACYFTNMAGVAVGAIQTSATATAYNTTSDVRLKHAIATLSGALDVLAALRPVKFRWNADDSVGHGFLAHELQRHVPDAVTGEPDAVNDDGSVKPQGVDQSKLVPWLTACCQELAQQVQALTARVTSLETQLGI
jgi:hypothetical protein